VRHSSPNLPEASVAVVGAGAVGQFYAAQLILAGHEVRILARRDAAVLAHRGLVVEQTPSPDIQSSQRLTRLTLLPERFTVGTEPTELIRPAAPSWVLVALKTTALPHARPLIEPLVGADTRVVVLCNGLGIEDELAEWLAPERVFGLLCFVAVNRDHDAAIRHLAFGHVVAGHFLDDPRERQALTDLWRSAGVRCDESSSLLEARWRKAAWNVPFNGLCVAYDCTTDAIVGDASRRAEADRLCREVIAIGNSDLAARGRTTRIEPGWAAEQLRRTDGMGPYAPSTLLDARAGRELETDTLLCEPLRRARRLGVAAPTLEWLVSVLVSR
jgi:2-dehydropantoate 2-reductase